MADADAPAEPAPAESVSVPVLIATIESRLARDTTARRNAVPDIVHHAMSSPRYTETETEPELEFGSTGIPETERRPPSPIRSAPAPPVSRTMSRRKIGMVMM